MTERTTEKTPEISSAEPTKIATETKEFENKIKNQKLRPITLESLDYTFVPSYVPTEFTKTVRPFFDRAKEICALWDRTLIAYRSMNFDKPIEPFLPTIIKAFKETVYQWKRRKIKTGFTPYYYGTIAGMLVAEKRRIVAELKGFCSWIG